MKEMIDKLNDYFRNDGVTLVKSITLVLIGYMLIKIFISALKRSVNRTKIEKTLPNFIISLLNIGLMAVLVIYVLKLCGISGDSVVTIASVISLGISLALQDTISSFANGILIIVNKPFTEGEYVSIGSVDGSVVSISMFNTTLKTADGLMITIPNSQVVSAAIKNYSRLPVRRIDIDIPVAYGTKSEKVKELVFGVVSKKDHILRDPAPSCRLVSYGDSNLNFVLKCWVPGDCYWDVRFDLLEQILDALVDAKISIDYNQMDIHIKDMPTIKTSARKDSDK